jgi:hypothetical protein
MSNEGCGKDGPGCSAECLTQRRQGAKEKFENVYTSDRFANSNLYLHMLYLHMPICRPTPLFPLRLGAFA